MNKLPADESKQRAPLVPRDIADHTKHQELALDEALDESFPASDPVAISIPKPSNSPL